MHVLCAAYKDVATSILQGKTRAALGINDSAVQSIRPSCLSMRWTGVFRSSDVTFSARTFGPYGSSNKSEVTYGTQLQIITSKIGRGSGSIF